MTNIQENLVEVRRSDDVNCGALCDEDLFNQLFHLRPRLVLNR